MNPLQFTAMVVVVLVCSESVLGGNGPAWLGRKATPKPKPTKTTKTTKTTVPITTVKPTVAALETTMHEVEAETTTMVPPSPSPTLPPMIETTGAPVELETSKAPAPERTTKASEKTTKAPAPEATKPAKPVTDAPTVPPTHFNCRDKDDGYYPDPKDKCSNIYYACVGHIARKLRCSSDELVYEPEKNACEHRHESYRCTGTRKTTLPTTTGRPAPPAPKLPIDCTKYDDGWYPDPEKKCGHTFYSCSNGIGSKFECPGNMYFDVESKMCLSYEDVIACAGKRRPTTKKPATTRRPIEKLPIDCADKPSGSYPDPEKKCSTIYYVCSNGDGLKRTCPGGLYFHPKKQMCDYFDEIHACTGKHKTTTPKPPSPKPSEASLPVPPSEFNCSSKPDGMHTPEKKKCSNIYYRCVGGVTYKLKCPQDLYYDVENDLCARYHELFVCSGKKPTTPLPTTPTPEPKPTEKLPIDCNSLEDGDFPDPEKKCSKLYYSCSGHAGTRRLCPEGLFFDKDLGICDLKSLVSDCGGKRPAITTPRPSKPEVPAKHPYSCDQKGDGNYAAGKCVDYYWTCVGSSTGKAMCPHGTFYDTERDECGYKDQIPACGGVRPTTPKP